MLRDPNNIRPSFGSKNRNVRINVPEELLQRLEKQSAETGVSMTNILRAYIYANMHKF